MMPGTYYKEFPVKITLALPLLASLLVACASDPNSHFVPEGMTAKDAADFANAQIILIGEQHDNPAHHKFQNEVLEKLSEQNRLKSVIFEQVDWDNQGPLSFLDRNNLNKLPKKIDWDKSGWPDYDLYRPLFETAVYARAKVIAGGLPKNRIPLLTKGNYEVAFSAAEMERLKIRTPLSEEALALMKKEIFDGHCQMIPEDHLDSMVPVQRARDAAMVKGYLKEADISGVTVFILGNGHARKDFGVPTLLKAIDPNLKVWSIGLMEEGSQQPPEGAYDKVWVTEKLEDREDPCQKMKEHLEKKNGAPKVEGEDKGNTETPPVTTPAEQPATEPAAETPAVTAPDAETPASETEEAPAEDAAAPDAVENQGE